MLSQTARAQGAGGSLVYVTRKGGATLCGGAGGREVCMVEHVFKEISRAGPVWIQTWTDHVSSLKCKYV